MSKTLNNQKLPIVRLKTPKKFTHPWIFQRSIEKSESKPQNGSIVDIMDSDSMWVGRGIYNGHSRIALRILTEDENQPIDRDFFYTKLQNAFNLRMDILKLTDKTDSYRLAHSEGDGLSGLVIEKFKDLIVIEYFSSGMYRMRPIIESVLQEMFPKSSLYFFADEHVQRQESIDIRSPKKPEPFPIEENGLQFLVEPGGRHKTGFFLDQRDNRKYLSEIVPKGDVLDLCCNSGGFAIYAASNPRVNKVVALDIDEDVIELAKRNVHLNKASFHKDKIQFVHVDIFPWLREAIAAGKQFETVILDPAKQTRTKEEVPAALRKYCDMNRLAIQMTKPGGLFVTCSCTGLVSESDFIESVRRASFQAKREVQIFKISGAAPDHPFSVHVNESRYLKALWARVL